MEDERVVSTIVVHVDDIFAVGEKTKCDQFWEIFEPDGSRQKPWRATLVFRVFLREGLGEEVVDDFPADIC